MTKQQTPLEALNDAIENAIVIAEPGASIEHQAKRLISEEKVLIEALTPEWQLAEVLRLFRVKRQEIARRKAAEDQYLLPGFEGLPQRIAIKDGSRHSLADATHYQLRQYLAVLHKRHRDHPRIAQVKALMELVHKYSRKIPGITVREVCAREAAKGA